MSDLLRCDGIPVAVICASSPGGPEKQDEAKIRRAWRAPGGGADNGGEKRKVLIVSVWLPIIIDLALLRKTQRRIEVLQMREQPVLLRATAAIALTCVNAMAAGCQLGSFEFHVAAPLALP